MTAQDFVVKTEELDALVRPWLHRGDSWRYGSDGFPEFDDMVDVYHRFAGPGRQPDLRLCRHEDGCRSIADALFGMRGTGDTTTEAMFHLLYNVLSYTPPEWNEEPSA